MSRPKAYFINGGAGRVICSIPAFEKLLETDKDFIIVCEGGTEMYHGHPTLGKKVYDHRHKNLFTDYLIDRDIVTPEPYRVWEYFNQKCSIAQAFDIEINNQGVRPLPAPKLNLNKMEIATAYKIVQDLKNNSGFDKVIVLQPFGRTIQQNYDMIVDPTSRSLAVQDVMEICKKLTKEYAVILMAEFQVDLGEDLNKRVMQVKIPSLRIWSGIIELADHFIGCDSVGQHIAKALDKTATVVLGSTFPINVSYVNDKNFDIIDAGKDVREYSPIRLTFDEEIDRANDLCMDLTPSLIDSIVKSAQRRAGKSVKRELPKNKNDQSMNFTQPNMMGMNMHPHMHR